ncbi:MAG TPA: BBP7 family outer membrane beta-barrel protein [Thermoanaerobaculia bacterium]|nr:BBP7 family outer membrane beta-barrel protein [Thermoanaerobaculia bacterium]
MNYCTIGALSLLLLACAAASPAQTVSTAKTAANDPFATPELWIKAEYLHWWVKEGSVDVPLITDGLVGESTTHVLLGGGDLENRTHDGFRVTFGYGSHEKINYEASLMALKSKTASNSVSSSGQLGSVDLLLPYFDAVSNRENVTEISLSPSYAGAAAEALTRNMTGVELSFVKPCDHRGTMSLDFVGGLRWFNLSENFTFTTSSPFIPPQAVDIWQTTDRFETRNNFYGVQGGIRAHWERERFRVGGAIKLGIGGTVQKVDVSGFLLTNDFNGLATTPQRFVGGYFAVPTNIGSRKRATFGILPEADVNLDYRITDWLSVGAGYSFLYINSVARPGDQINRTINTTQSVSWTGELNAALKGPAEPSFDFHGSSFWAHGLNAGLTFHF